MMCVMYAHSPFLTGSLYLSILDTDPLSSCSPRSYYADKCAETGGNSKEANEAKKANAARVREARADPEVTKSLPAKERELMMARHGFPAIHTLLEALYPGLDDGVLRSTRECAAVLGIGKESVRQICLKAFRKLRGTRLGAALLDYMD